MENVMMFCDDPECPCENICCQGCKDLSICNKKCDSIKYKEKIYSSDQFLINELEKLAKNEDNWLLVVAIEKIKTQIYQLKQIKNNIQELRDKEFKMVYHKAIPYSQKVEILDEVLNLLDY